MSTRTRRTMVAAFLSFAVVCFAKPAHAVAVTVEVEGEVEKLVDAPLARRLIRLELADVELPRVNGIVPTRHTSAARYRTSDEVVFVRLLRQGEVLLVELWARGELYGERRLVLTSNEQHQARRVALASAELARGLREARVRERQRLLREHLAPNPVTARTYSMKVNAVGSVAVSAAAWPSVDTVLIGPRLYLGALTEQGVGVGVTGGVFTSTAATVVRSWSELGLRPSWQATLSPWLDLGVGLNFAAGVVDIEPSATFAGSELSHQTWQTKAGVDARLEWRMNPRVSLTVEPEVAHFIRKLRVESQRGAETLDGVWLAVALGALVYL